MAETGKKRSGRIPLDYYKTRDRFSAARRYLTWAAIGFTAWWASGIGWGAFSPSQWAERSRRLASHGTLARQHATWESRCDACHVEFSPIGGPSPVSPILGSSKESDQRCQGCHAGPVHHDVQTPQEIACATCHRDHMGADASLVRMSDKNCTQCHANLAVHVKSGQVSAFASSVTRFDTDPSSHPEFRATKADDPGNLKFNHALHLSPGMRSNDGGPVQTLDRLAPADRERYRRFASEANGTIQLDCTACHVLDGGDSLAGGKPALSRRGGAYMLPVDYQKQCAACHPLPFDIDLPKRMIPHGLQLDEVHEMLGQIYAKQYLSENPALLEQRLPPRPLPGQAETPETAQVRQAIESKVATAERVLFGAKKCGECHSYEDANGLTIDSLARWNPALPARVRATQVPDVWFTHASFDHSAHRAVDCRTCHDRAFPDSPQASRVSQDVLLPSMATCATCHSPKNGSTDPAKMTGGARFDCTECHRFHNGDAPSQGLGALARDAQSEKTIREFLLGSPAKHAD